MKLDKRIENERLIYTPFTTNKPKLHEKGYFTDDIHAFNSLEDCDCRYGELVEHDDVDYAYPYCCKYADGCGDGSTTCDWFAFYIPESSLKQTKEKQYRVFTIGELKHDFTIGNIVTFRHKADKNSEYRVICNGYHINSDGEFIIYLGIWKYTPQELFDYYELLNSVTAKWQPFGVEVKE